MADTPTRLDNLDAALLEPIVTASVEAPNPVKVTAWTWETVTGGLGGQGVYRVCGSALADTVATEWSVIVKVLRSGESNTEPSSESFWLREREVIRSGLLEGVEDGVSAPRCLAVEDIAPDETWLWFEELHNDLPHPWPTETWAEVARQFGRWQGEYLVGKPLPSHEWLCTGWLERCFTDWGPPRLFEQLPHPVLSRLYPGDSAASIERFWDHREVVLAAYRRAPLAVAHLDAGRRNLFLRDGQVVAIDWAFASSEPAGADLAGLITSNIWGQETSPDKCRDFDQAVFSGYLAGLTDVGWRGDADAVRLVFLVATCLRHSTVFASTARWLARKTAEPFWDVMATILGAQDQEETILQWARANQSLAECADEARRMI
ncbi:MAG: hypothetical protein ABGY41_17820 [Candidatus Poribacteria bacterium]